MTALQPTAAVVTRVLPAPRAVVYREWLDPEALMDWMCPRPARPIGIDLDPRVGGAIRIDIEEDGVVFSVTGRYLELDPPRRLAFTWTCSTWPDPTWDSVVTVTLEPEGEDTTTMTIHHALPSDLGAAHEDGWARIAEQFGHRLLRRA
jgi:uncharacterized protein YndB with AHSA1/START domain